MSTAGFYSDKVVNMSLWERLFGKEPKGPALEKEDYEVVEGEDALDPKKKRRAVRLRNGVAPSPEYTKSKNKPQLGRLDDAVALAYVGAFSRDGMKLVDAPSMDMNMRQERLAAFEKATSGVTNNGADQLKQFMEVAKRDIAKVQASDFAALTPGGPSARGDNDGANPSYLNRDTIRRDGSIDEYQYGAGMPHPQMTQNVQLSAREQEALQYKAARHAQWREEMLLGPMAPHLVPIKKNNS